MYNITRRFLTAITRSPVSLPRPHTTIRFISLLQRDHQCHCHAHTQLSASSVYYSEIISATATPTHNYPLHQFITARSSVPLPRPHTTIRFISLLQRDHQCHCHAHTQLSASSVYYSEIISATATPTHNYPLHQFITARSSVPLPRPHTTIRFISLLQ